MADWREFGASNEPDTCLWCGNKLRYLSKHSHYETSEVPLDPNDYNDQFLIEEGHTTKKKYSNVVDERWAKSGGYHDGFFCGLRCAYQFAVRLAQLGRRLSTQGRSHFTK